MCRTFQCVKKLLQSVKAELESINFLRKYHHASIYQIPDNVCMYMYIISQMYNY